MRLARQLPDLMPQRMRTVDHDFIEQDFEEAMEACASEPVHIPGTVQSFGCLVGVNAHTGHIAYASQNCADIIGIRTADLMGADVRDAFGQHIAHALNNAAARSGFAHKLAPLGRFNLGTGDVELSAFTSEGTHVLQFEAAQDQEFGGGDALNTLVFLMGQLQACTNHAELFELTTDLLRHITGFDRVMIYKFDRDFNGEVVAETKQRAMEPFLGLHFPQWDIPPQARAIMAKLPLRIIADVDQKPVQLSAAVGSLPPLDITLADCRGVSEVHIEYLRNMDVKATMTLSINVEGALWGIISFHHRHPRVPAPKMRELLTAFLELFSTKLCTLMKQEQLDLVRKIDAIKDDVLREIDDDENMYDAIPSIGPVIEEILKAKGVVLLTGSRTVSHGQVPDQAVLAHIFHEAREQIGTPIISENLGLQYPQFKEVLKDCAGVLAVAITENRVFCIFRDVSAKSVSWAGNPEKKIEQLSGTPRLAPRASFSKYLQNVEGCSVAWTDDDVYFAERVWVLINSAERRALKNTLSRQQGLMINELHHRVRNILALVRSVSRQARRHYGSLESYSASLENRINALAAAHDIASGSTVSAVEVLRLIRVETEPYQKDHRISITGENRYLNADIAPIFSLVIHELATNAAKYGALSVDKGTVAVTVTDVRGGVSIEWRENHGPLVVPPKDRGFGSALIEQAIPHEMGGSTDLRFIETGAEADLFLPNDVFELDHKPKPQQETEEKSNVASVSAKPFDPDAFEGLVLVLEDNFVIAKDMKDQLEEAGIDDIAIASSTADALEILSEERPTFAILDVNLGSGKTSEQVALQLGRKGVPFVFVTGYGDKAELPPELKHVLRLTKPVATLELQDAMMEVLHQQNQ